MYCLNIDWVTVIINSQKKNGHETHGEVANSRESISSMLVHSMSNFSFFPFAFSFFVNMWNRHVGTCSFFILLSSSKLLLFHLQGRGNILQVFSWSCTKIMTKYSPCVQELDYRAGLFRDKRLLIGSERGNILQVFLWSCTKIITKYSSCVQELDYCAELLRGKRLIIGFETVQLQSIK